MRPIVGAMSKEMNLVNRVHPFISFGETPRVADLGGDLDGDLGHLSHGDSATFGDLSRVHPDAILASCG